MVRKTAALTDSGLFFSLTSSWHGLRHIGWLHAADRSFASFKLHMPIA
ncbi:hypothetical protein [Paraburkholderia phenazinium]|jgi:hypothetical protein|nr:hypothetical protein [Paraburkholderia phenazinium]